jgi:hypothetical protein
MRGTRQVIALCAIGALTLGVAILTALEPAWIEAVAGFDPDNGNGALEWVIVLVLAALALVAAYLGVRRQRARARAAAGSPHAAVPPKTSDPR